MNIWVRTKNTIPGTLESVCPTAVRRGTGIWAFFGVLHQPHSHPELCREEWRGWVSSGSPKTPPKVPGERMLGLSAPGSSLSPSVCWETLNSSQHCVLPSGLSAQTDGKKGEDLLADRSWNSSPLFPLQLCSCLWIQARRARPVPFLRTHFAFLLEGIIRDHPTQAILGFETNTETPPSSCFPLFVQGERWMEHKSWNVFP